MENLIIKSFVVLVDYIWDYSKIVDMNDKFILSNKR